MECEKCKGKIFWIEEKNSCDNCEFNAAPDDETDKYIWDSKKIEEKGLKRTEVSDVSECWFGSNWKIGCFLITCPGCGHKWNIPYMVGGE